MRIYIHILLQLKLYRSFLKDSLRSIGRGTRVLMYTYGLDVITAGQTETGCVVRAFVLSTPHLESRDHGLNSPHALSASSIWLAVFRSVLVGSRKRRELLTGPLPRPGFGTNCIFFSFARFGSPSSRLGNRQDPSALVYGQKEAWLYTCGRSGAGSPAIVTKLLTAQPQVLPSS